MRHWIRTPHREGQGSRQAHADLPEHAPYEREMGRSGFSGPTAHLHHQRPPTSWSGWDGPLRPRAYNLAELGAQVASPWEAPVVLSSAYTQVRYWHLNVDMQSLARNADGDQLMFVHAGGGELHCDFGHLSLREGDYLMLPRGTMWRLEPRDTMDMLMIEATGDSFGLPDKGLVGPQALFDPAMLDRPAIDGPFIAQQGEDPWTIEIKRNNALSRVHYDYNPLDVIGWHGDLSPVRINWRDFRPLASHRYHLPPSAHSTFVAERFVVCTFVPRPFETDPGALKVPFFHNNDDFDEVIFYHAGKFFSRDNIVPGMLTWHAAGFTHGPHPAALKHRDTVSAAMTDDVAVMIDTRDGLTAGPEMESVEWSGYVDSWKTPEAVP